MRAIDLAGRFDITKHPENGSFKEYHYESTEGGRAGSGSIVYYVGPEEKTEFHVIDCDEYWCYSEGADLEIWIIDEEHKLRIEKLGVEEGSMPFVYVKKGSIFASKHGSNASDGTFLVCITVPRFSYDGFRLVEKEEAVEYCPDVIRFFEQ